MPEKETRRRLLMHARLVGCEREMMIIHAKYDKLLRNCKNDLERIDIGKCAWVEIFNLLGGRGQLIINGEVIINDKNQ